MSQFNANRFLPNLVCALILWSSCFGLLIGKFCQFLSEFSGHHMSVFSFLDDNFSKYQWIFTKLDMSIDIVEIWFGIANGQISSIFDRAHNLPTTCLYFYFLTITWVNINGFSPNLVCASILWRSGLGLLMGKFRQLLTVLPAHPTIVVGFIVSCYEMGRHIALGMSIHLSVYPSVQPSICPFISPYRSCKQNIRNHFSQAHEILQAVCVPMCRWPDGILVNFYKYLIKLFPLFRLPSIHLSVCMSSLWDLSYQTLWNHVYARILNFICLWKISWLVYFSFLSYSSSWRWTPFQTYAF